MGSQSTRKTRDNVKGGPTFTRLRPAGIPDPRPPGRGLQHIRGDREGRQRGACFEISAGEVRGPWKLLTAELTPEQRQAWFREQGQAAIRLKNEKGRYGDPETVYCNAKFRCSGYTVRKRPDTICLESKEWYRQATWAGNEWKY